MVIRLIKGNEDTFAIVVGDGVDPATKRVIMAGCECLTGGSGTHEELGLITMERTRFVELPLGIIIEVVHQRDVKLNRNGHVTWRSEVTEIRPVDVHVVHVRDGWSTHHDELVSWTILGPMTRHHRVGDVARGGDEVPLGELIPSWLMSDGLVAELEKFCIENFGHINATILNQY